MRALVQRITTDAIAWVIVWTVAAVTIGFYLAARAS